MGLRNFLVEKVEKVEKLLLWKKKVEKFSFGQTPTGSETVI